MIPPHERIVPVTLSIRDRMSCSLPAARPLEHGQDRRFCPLVFLPLKVSMDGTALHRRFPSKTPQRPLEIPMSPPPAAAVGIGKSVRSRARKRRPSTACIGHAIRRIPSNFFVVRTLEARRARFRHRRGGRREPFPQVAYNAAPETGVVRAPCVRKTQKLLASSRFACRRASRTTAKRASEFRERMQPETPTARPKTGRR